MCFVFKNLIHRNSKIHWSISVIFVTFSWCYVHSHLFLSTCVMIVLTLLSGQGITHSPRWSRRGEGGSLWTLTQKKHFSKKSFWPNSIHIKTTLKYYHKRNKNWKIMFGLENRDETLIFITRHFDQTMAILISHFFRFGAPKVLTGDCFVIKIKQNNIIRTKTGCFIHFSIFTTLSHRMFSPFILYRVAYKWRMDKIT